MSNSFTVERFLENVKDHVMTIESDNALNRVLLFKKPESSNRYFRITTWDNHLAISGDMGCYVWSRTQDMFQFFRNEELVINRSYWHEKLMAESQYFGCHEYDNPKAKSEIFDAIFRHFEINQDLKDVVKNRMASNLTCEYDSAFLDLNFSDEMIEMLENYADIEDEHTFTEFMRNVDYDFAEGIYSCGKSMTSHYIWCMHAVVWAIQQYDKVKDESQEKTL